MTNVTKIMEYVMPAHPDTMGKNAMRHVHQTVRMVCATEILVYAPRAARWDIIKKSVISHAHPIVIIRDVSC